VGEPDPWTTRVVDLTGIADRFTDDPQTEFVEIRNGVVTLTRQEYIHIVTVRLSEGTIIRDVSARPVTHPADATPDRRSPPPPSPGRRGPARRGPGPEGFQRTGTSTRRWA
jgi:hypothetical protein